MPDEESFKRKNELAQRWRRRMNTKAHDGLQYTGGEDPEESIASYRRRLRRDPEWADTEKEDHPDDEYA